MKKTGKKSSHSTHMWMIISSFFLGMSLLVLSGMLFSTLYLTNM